MLKSYLVVAVRNLMRQKLYSAINIVGLAVGMACSILILQYVRYDADIGRVAFSYQFLDDRIAGSYRVFRQEATITFFAAGMAILVAILGLVGLTAYATEQRAKEISIRKVLGASVPSVVALLTNELLRLVVLANILALPVAYYLVRNWLEQFAYRIELGPGIFLIGSASVAALALLTASGLALRAASANPVEGLRSE